MFGSWESNLMTEWHARYGGAGVMIYWHVERKSVCVYSQLKTCSSSEVAAMMEGLIRHGADIDSQITANHTDTHGPSVVGFAFTRLLGYRLLPRLKNIGAARLYRPADGASYPRLEPVLTRAITWNSANVAIHYGREAELPGADREAQEISMLCLHLLKSALGLAPRLDACCRTGSARGRRGAGNERVTSRQTVDLGTRTGSRSEASPVGGWHIWKGWPAGSVNKRWLPAPHRTGTSRTRPAATIRA
jgi:TnpA family transposase